MFNWLLKKPVLLPPKLYKKSVAVRTLSGDKYHWEYTTHEPYLPNDGRMNFTSDFLQYIDINNSNSVIILNRTDIKSIKTTAVKINEK